MRDVLVRLSSGQLSNKEELKACEDFIEAKKRSSCLDFLLELALILRDSDTESLAYSALIHIGLVLNKSRYLPVLTRQWLKAPVEARMTMRNMFTSLLGNPARRFRENAAYCLAGFLYLEYRNGFWPEFFDELFALIGNAGNGENAIEGGMFVLTELFRRSFFKDEPRKEDMVHEIFRVIFSYLSDQKTPTSLRPALLVVFNTGIYTFDTIFSDESVIVNVLQTLLLNLTLQDENVHRKVYESLELVCVRYFKCLNDFLVARIVEALAIDLRSEININKDLAINFWVKFAGAASDNHNSAFVLQVAPSVVPLLLTTMKDPQNDDEDIVQVKRSSMLCLSFFVSAGGPPITPPILEFIDTNLAAEAACDREAALFAIYSNLELRDFYPVLMQRFQRILELAADPSSDAVQDAALFILAFSLKHYPQILESAQQFNLLLGIVSRNLNRPIKVIQRCFELLCAIFNTFDSSEKQSFLGTNFDGIWNMFLAGLSLSEFRQPEFMTSFFEAMNALIMHLPQSCEENVFNILRNVLDSVNKEVRTQVVGANSFQFVAFMCSVVSTIAARTRLCIEPFADDIMNMLLFILRQQDCMIYEEALITVDSLALIMKERFAIYHEPLIPFAMTGFETGDPRVICQASHLIGDLFDSASPFLITLVDKVYDSIVKALENPNIPIYMKPYILDAFISVGAQKRRDYDRVFKDLLIFLGSMQKTKIDTTQKDEVEFGYALYEAVLRGYVLSIEIYSEKAEIMTNIPQMLQVIDCIMNDSLISLKIMDRFIKLLHRLVQVCGKDVCARYLNTRPAVKGLFDIVMESGHERLVENAQTLQSEIEGHLSRT